MCVRERRETESGGEEKRRAVKEERDSTDLI